MADAQQIWAKIEGAPRPKLTELFAAGDRLAAFAHDEAGIHFDFSKTHLTPDLVADFAELVEAQGFTAKRDLMFSGGIANPSEGRPVEHTAERGEGSPESVASAKQFHERMRALIDAIEAGAMGPIRQLIHIGIGGSALGPKLLVDALGREESRYEVAIVSNVDGEALHEVFKRFDPAATIVAIASKTFTTTETLMNTRSVLAWMEEGGVADPYGRCIALTAAPDKAIEFGIDETRVLPFHESVGGRYSLWSSIGFPAALALGWAKFEELLEGAAKMDRHFRHTEPAKNIPMLAAFADLYYGRVRGAETLGIFCYDERLQLLYLYLQQLIMESNGKRVAVDGEPVPVSSPIVWGGVGTDAQHAVFQLLHQGTHLVPVEFVACIQSDDGLDEEHHRALLNNCFAQGAALMAGRHSDDPQRNYPGDRPSTTILFDELDPARLGALIAFYEHRVFTFGVAIGINSFDQFGVELGKEMAKAAEKGGGDFDASTTDLMKRAFG